MGFVAITDGQVVPLTHGVQQGFHVWTNLRAHNLCFQKLTITRTATFVDTNTLIIKSQDQLTLVRASDPTLGSEGWGELSASRPTFLCPNALGQVIPGRMIALGVQALDTAGRTAAAQHVVVTMCPSNAFLEMCENQCAPGVSFDGGVD